MEISKVLVLGDTHCNYGFLKSAMDVALDNNCDCIFQLGDFGYFPQTKEGIEFLSASSYSLDRMNLPLYWLPGNHEDYDSLYGTEFEITSEGFWRILPNIFYVPRGWRWVWSNRTLLALGGAASIDKEDRLRWERHANRPRSLWWPEELITEADVTRALSTPGPVDIMFSHDIPAKVSLKDLRLLDSWAIDQNRGYLQQVMDAVQPKYLYHGHLHHRYQLQYTCYSYSTLVTGLSCDGHGSSAWTILDLKNPDLDKRNHA